MVGRASLLCSVALAVSGAPAAALQGRLRAAEFYAQHDGVGAQVRLRYQLDRDAGTTELPVSLLPFRGTSVDSIRVRVGGVALPLSLAAEPTGRLRGHVPLGEAGTGSTTIEIDYTVRNTGGGRVKLPLVAAMWPPAQARPGLFAGEVRVAGALTAYNAFPATLRAGSVEGNSRAYTLSMPVLPAVVSFDLAQDAPAITLVRALDVIVVLLTLAFCGLLWRQFQTQSRS